MKLHPGRFALTAGLVLWAAIPGFLPTLVDAQQPRRPGIGENDPRVRVDVDQMPWRNLGKLQIASQRVRLACTGSLVGANLVLTAAHCLFNARTGMYFAANDMHFLVAFNRGNQAAHARVVRFETGTGYDPWKPAESRGSDWALLTVDAAYGEERMLGVRDNPLPVGSQVMVGGYNEDQSFTITADTECKIVDYVRDPADKLMLRHNCTATRGVSGAPVLYFDGADWLVAGVNVAAPAGEAGGVAVIPLDIRRRM